MNKNLIALILSKNLANRNYNYIVKDLLKSNNYSVGIICNLLYNPHINREAIKMTLDSIDEIDSYGLFEYHGLQYDVNEKLITEIAKSKNNHVNKYLINCIVNTKLPLSDNLLKVLYKTYKVSPIALCKKELIKLIFHNHPDVIQQYYSSKLLTGNISDAMLEYFIGLYFESTRMHELHKICRVSLLTEKQINSLIRLDIYDIHVNLCQNTGLSKKHIDKFVRMECYSINIELSKNPCISKDQMQYFLDNDYGEFLAQNPSLDKEIATEILHHFPIALRPIKS